MTIENQKAVADKILSTLELADPYCIIAGGAPRDWYFGNLANDLDVYYYTSADTMNVSRKQLENLFPGCNPVPLCEVARSDENLYSTMPFLKRIWNAVIDGEDVQFIQLDSRKQFEVVSKMDVSICQIWYKHGKIQQSNNFKLGEKLKVMWTLNNCTWQDKHPQKMKERFTGYSLTNKDQLFNIMSRELLES